MKQFEISADAERSLNVLVDWFGARRGGRIVDAYDWVRDELRRMPELGTLEPDGRTRVLVARSSIGSTRCCPIESFYSTFLTRGAIPIADEVDVR
jgi:hypothetical protein